METKIAIFIGLTFYLIIVGVAVASVSSLVYESDFNSTGYQNASGYTTDQTRTGLFSNAGLLWDMISFDVNSIGLAGSIFGLLFITIPFILWWIVLFSMIFGGS